MPRLAGCRDTKTKLSCRQAREIVEPIFVVLRDQHFAELFPRVVRAKLRCDPTLHDRPRHFASTLEEDGTVLFAPEFAELPEEKIVGILAHELGHSADFLYPGLFDVDEKRNLVRPVSRREWEERPHDRVEFTADAIANRAMRGKGRIGYVGACVLQSLTAGRQRPRGLR